MFSSFNPPGFYDELTSRPSPPPPLIGWVQRLNDCPREWNPAGVPFFVPMHLGEREKWRKSSFENVIPTLTPCREPKGKASSRSNICSYTFPYILINMLHFFFFFFNCPGVSPILPKVPAAAWPPVIRIQNARKSCDFDCAQCAKYLPCAPWPWLWGCSNCCDLRHWSVVCSIASSSAGVESGAAGPPTLRFLLVLSSALFPLAAEICRTVANA